LLKSSGYEAFLNETKKDSKKLKVREADSDGVEKKFVVKFEKRGRSSKAAKFVKFSNKKKK